MHLALNHANSNAGTAHSRTPFPRVLQGKLEELGIGELARFHSASSAYAPTELLEAIPILNQALAKLGPAFPAPAPLRVEYDVKVRPHPHAATSYGALSERDYVNALSDLIRTRALGALELNFHLPHEIQFEKFRDLETGALFMDFVDFVSAALGVTAVWENAPILGGPAWTLVCQTDFVPADRMLCLDIGHLMLGSLDRTDALHRIDQFVARFGPNIRHLHLHVNDFTRDQHRNDPAEVIDFLGLERFRALTSGRTYIFEKGL